MYYLGVNSKSDFIFASFFKDVFYDKNVGRHGHIIFYLVIAKYDSDTKSFQTAYTFYVHYKDLTFSITLERGDYIVYLLLSAN